MRVRHEGWTHVMMLVTHVCCRRMGHTPHDTGIEQTFLCNVWTFREMFLCVTYSAFLPQFWNQTQSRMWLLLSCPSAPLWLWIPHRWSTPCAWNLNCCFFICWLRFFLIAPCLHDRDGFTSAAFPLWSYYPCIHTSWLHLLSPALSHTGTHSGWCFPVQQRPVPFSKTRLRASSSSTPILSLSLFTSPPSTHTHTHTHKHAPRLVSNRYSVHT